MLSILILTAVISANPLQGYTGVVFVCSETCGPCRRFSPVVDNATILGWPIITVKVGDQEQGKRWSVTAVPTMIRYVNGVEKDRRVGAMTPMELQRFLGGLP
jgi:hypothetical protein